LNKLSDLNILPVYNKTEEVKSFYNQTLSVAHNYKRVSAYFSGGIFRHISKGISNLLINDGKMQLITSINFEKRTYDELVKGFELRESKDDLELLRKISFNEDFLANLENSNDISVLAYLIAIEKIDLRIALKNKGIFHDKFGIISDDANNKLLFSGSNNETEAAVNLNYESFETTYNWDSPSRSELDKITLREKEFNNLWNNQVEELEVVTFPEILKRELFENIPFEKIKVVHQDIDTIRVSLGSDKEIIIQSSVDLDVLLTYPPFRPFRSFVGESNKKRIEIKGLEEFKDFLRFKSLIENLSDNIGVRLAYTHVFNDYIRNQYLDIDHLSSVGSKIKDFDNFKNNEEFITFKSDVNSLLNRPLRDAQLLSAMHIVKMKRSMNFSVPGSGKTSSILGAFEYLSNINNYSDIAVKNLIIFGPINCFKAWQDEYAIVSKAYDKRSTSQIIDIKQYDDIVTKKILLKYDFKFAKIILVNFEAIINLEETLIELVEPHTMVVFDEIHRIKKYESQKFLSLKKIIALSQYRVALTGTPLPNGYKDLVNTFDILFDSYAQSYFYMYPEELRKSDKDFESLGIENLSLNKMIYPFYIRTNKKELEVPPPNPDNLVIIEPTDSENKLYFDVLESSINHFEIAIRLIQVSSIPSRLTSNIGYNENYLSGYVDENEFHTEVDFLNTSKLDKLKELLKTNRRKSIIWCIFIETIFVTKKMLEEEGFKVAIIFGRTPIEERNRIIDSFNKTSEYDILITNPHTLAESVSLHKTCHDAYYLELNYNLAQFVQSKDRIHRLGLAPDDVTNYYILITKYGNDLERSIDYKIYSRLQLKEKRMVNAIEQGSLLLDYEYDDDGLKKIVEEIKSD
jgi:hypothetical protein